MFYLCINEIVKILKKKITIIFVIAIVVILLLFGMLNKHIVSLDRYGEEGNSETLANNNILKTQVLQLKESAKKSEAEGNVKEKATTDIFIYYYQYAIDNNIPFFWDLGVRTPGNEVYWKKELIYQLLMLNNALIGKNLSETKIEKTNNSIEALNNILEKDDYHQYLDYKIEEYKEQYQKKEITQDQYELGVYMEELNKEYELTRYNNPEDVGKYSSFATIKSLKNLLLDGKGDKYPMGNIKTTEEEKVELKHLIEVEKYRIENKINSNNTITTNYNDQYVKNAESIVFIVFTLFMIIISASIVSSEFSKGTIKQVLMTPHKRWKIVLSKIIALLVILIVFSIVLSLLVQLFGNLFFGEHQLSPYVYWSQGGIDSIPSSIYHIARFFVYDIKIVVYVLFSVMLSTFFRSSVFSVTIPMIIYTLEPVLLDVISPNMRSTIDFVFFNLMNCIFQYESTTSGIMYTLQKSLAGNGNMYYSILFALCLSILFIVISIATFKRRKV
ncbi:MAG: ABC transporter permease subunit [Clostridia bacterium]|nr:ABC transporter permease subunit [Clostridia bacterium]